MAEAVGSRGLPLPKRSRLKIEGDSGACGESRRRRRPPGAGEGEARTMDAVSTVPEASPANRAAPQDFATCEKFARQNVAFCECRLRRQTQVL